MDVAQLTAECDEEKRLHKNDKKKLATLKKELDELRDDHGSVTSEGSTANHKSTAAKASTPVKKSLFGLGRK